LRDQLSFQLRTDWNAIETQSQAHTLSLRLNQSTNDQDSTRISALDLAQHGGETGARNRAGALTLDSRVGGLATNGLALAYNEGWNDASPYIALPEGRVRVTSQFADGTSGTQTLVFGGNRNMPTDAYNRNLQLNEDLSFLLPIGAQLHRIKLGGMLQSGRTIQTNNNNLLGSFTYNSLADFQANRPARYDRQLAAQDTRMGTMTGALYLGDTWRVTEPLEITAGLRWDYNRLRERPAYNPAVEQAFGRRTDIEPVASSLSPRLGFNYLVSSGGGVRSGKVISGGVGLFAGQPPTNLFATAVHQTGLPGADALLSCIGASTPTPDWADYLSDPSSIPGTCINGASSTNPLANAAPTVTLIDPTQKLPSSLRAQIGYLTPLPLNVTGSLQYSYSRGLGLWGYYDVNLNQAHTFAVGNEGRPFFGDRGNIVPLTGQTTLAGSRLNTAFGNVWDIRADRASIAHQVTAQLSGMLPHGVTLVSNYTLSFAHDQGSGRFSSAPTAGNPNVVEWSASDQDRRHTINLTLAKAFTPEIEIAAIGRLQSGAPYTPMVGGDINGDGVQDDRAFVFNPAAAADSAVANGMGRLMASLSGGARDCLQAQLGQIAGRNSCRGPWSTSLSLRASLRPNLPTLERRLTISVDAQNVMEGLDQLVHGANKMQGWGEALRPDSRLLDVRGFDPATAAFRYQVNEDFGRTIRGPSAIRSPFTLRISARMAIGGISFLSNRGFGNIAMGDMGGRGARGGFGGDGGFAGGGPGGFGGMGGFNRRDTLALNPDSIAARAVSNPLPAIIALKDSVKLTPVQVASLKAISDSLDLRLAVRRDSLRAAVSRVDLSPLRRQASQPRAAPSMLGRDFGDGPMGRMPDPKLRDAMQNLQKAMAPGLDSVRADVARSLAAARKVITPQQWDKLPFALRAPATGGAGRGFNAVGMIDRMLANPIPVVLLLKDTLGLTAEQVAKIQVISDKLQARLTKERESLGKRFDNTAAADQARLFADIQPTIQSARQQVADALQDVKKVLTAQQWTKLPSEVTNPFARRGGRPGN
ncbi:MAG TPA: TonB-dependent receptor, partial [Longimicrobiales bacterium]